MNKEKIKKEDFESKKEVTDKKKHPGQKATDQKVIDSDSDGQVDKEQKDSAKKEISVKEQLIELKDKYLRLYSEFENYRRRTSRERFDFMETANEELILSLLPVLDDLKRAGESFNNVPDIDGLKKGFNLISNKLKKSLEQKGLKLIIVKQGDAFNADLHEAVSKIPAPKKKLSGKIVDTIEDGYQLGDKVIRYAKVVIGN